ncbi:MAG: LysR family transcriptional regulator, partial [Oscillospiraceae bacterium]|nr:LysR family transcriptional regulator [Oscillospiraceae bacterium]
MTLRHMEIFRALCRNDFNTTKTAHALNMTQPAVSLAIKELEN